MSAARVIATPRAAGPDALPRAALDGAGLAAAASGIAAVGDDGRRAGVQVGALARELIAPHG